MYEKDKICARQKKTLELSATEVMIWPIHQQQPTTCTRELLAGELAQCSQCSLIWDEKVHVDMELIEHKYQFRYNFFPLISQQEPKRISFLVVELPASKGELARDICTVYVVFIWSNVSRIFHQVSMWTVSPSILGNFRTLSYMDPDTGPYVKQFLLLTVQNMFSWSLNWGSVTRHFLAVPNAMGIP